MAEFDVVDVCVQYKQPPPTPPEEIFLELKDDLPVPGFRPREQAYFSESAEEVWKRAQEIAGEGLPFNSLHVLQALLKDENIFTFFAKNLQSSNERRIPDGTFATPELKMSFLFQLIKRTQQATHEHSRPRSEFGKKIKKIAQQKPEPSMENVRNELQLAGWQTQHLAVNPNDLLKRFLQDAKSPHPNSYAGLVLREFLRAPRAAEMVGKL